LGATGSIGASTIDLIKRQPQRFRVEAVSANTNAVALATLARGRRPLAAVEICRYRDLKNAGRNGYRGGGGRECLGGRAQRPAQWVIGAITGAAGLRPTLAAAERGAIVAIANKECLVCAGGLFMRRAAAAGASVLPFDSEHNALFQAMSAGRREDVRRVILAASGGPFRTWSGGPDCAATSNRRSHPNWSMGPKVTIDPQHVANKALK
jgi:1-deoxy-D-xylulose-5-phosphate reductoisomerase